MAHPNAMQEWLKQQMASGFASFAGARVAATVPVDESLINDLIVEAIAAAASGTTGAQRSASPVGDLDVPALARLVRHARIHATQGVLTLDVEIGVDDRPAPATRRD